MFIAEQHSQLQSLTINKQLPQYISKIQKRVCKQALKRHWLLSTWPMLTKSTAQWNATFTWTVFISGIFDIFLRHV